VFVSEAHVSIYSSSRLSTGTAWLFLFAVLMSAALLFTMVFFVRPSVLPVSPILRSLTRPGVQIIMFSDLETDYINPIDLCNKLNQVRVRVPRTYTPR
jgi:hypothetical protein